jgi:hypothetical protein
VTDTYADVVATIALAAAVVLGVPILRNLFIPGDLEIIVQQYGNLQHWCGRPQLWLGLDIRNIGGRSTTISKINLLMEHDGRVWLLRGETYSPQDPLSRLLSAANAYQEMLVGSITLAPDQHWRETINAYDYPPESDEKLLNELRADMVTDIEQKDIARGHSQVSAKTQTTGVSQPIEVDPSLVASARDYFKKHFGLTAGHYKLFVAATFENGKRRHIQGFEFTLWDQTAKDLSGVADRYKYGLVHAHSKGARLSVRLKPMVSKEIAKEYDKLASQVR